MPTSGPEARFDLIFEQNHEAVQRYCVRRLPWPEVNDAVADVFLVAWRRIDEVPDTQELPWLYGIAKNVIRNAHRSRRRQEALRRRVGVQDRMSEPSAEVHVVRSFDERAILDALATLRHSDQEILRLRCWEQLGNGDIAVMLGVSTHAVDMRINRARRQLERSLARIDAQRPGASRTVLEGGER
ncbi:MAG TPA: sigma-70 family RNA polymerase sigma factor [Acidimicrobiia bacterium]|nr:sigma-70 family RNA polymerase sigma factor [Acidimicrobiia bacterium]